MNTQKTGGWILSLVFAVLLLFPLYILFKISVSPPADIFQGKTPYGITHFTWKHFSNTFTAGSALYGPLQKSLVTAVLATFFSLLLAIPSAYVIARMNVRLRYGFILALFISRMVPEISIALPVSIQFIQLGLFDTTAGLVMAHLIRILPVSCFILISVFSEFPESLERQARVDGLTRLEAVCKVVLPLSLSGIAVAALFSFLLSWDEFIYASYLTLTKPTMPLQVYYYVSRGNLFYSATYAILITLPVLLLTFGLQRYVKPQYLAGSMKG